MLGMTSWKNTKCASWSRGWESRQCSLQLPISPAVFVSLSEISALRFITDSKGSGINLIKYAYHLHFDDPEVVKNICMLINEMVQYGEMAAALVESRPLPHPQKAVKKTITAAAQGHVSCSQETYYVPEKGR